MKKPANTPAVVTPAAAPAVVVDFDFTALRPASNYDFVIESKKADKGDFDALACAAKLPAAAPKCNMLTLCMFDIYTGKAKRINVKMPAAAYGDYPRIFAAAWYTDIAGKVNDALEKLPDNNETPDEYLTVVSDVRARAARVVDALRIYDKYASKASAYIIDIVRALSGAKAEQYSDNARNAYSAIDAAYKAIDKNTDTPNLKQFRAAFSKFAELYNLPASKVYNVAHCNISAARAVALFQALKEAAKLNNKGMVTYDKPAPARIGLRESVLICFAYLQDMTPAPASKPAPAPAETIPA